jgi:hypothetical protein
MCRRRHAGSFTNLLAIARSSLVTPSQTKTAALALPCADGGRCSVIPFTRSTFFGSRNCSSSFRLPPLPLPPFANTVRSTEDYPEGNPAARGACNTGMRFERPAGPAGSCNCDRPTERRSTRNRPERAGRSNCNNNRGRKPGSAGQAARNALALVPGTNSRGRPRNRADDDAPLPPSSENRRASSRTDPDGGRNRNCDRGIGRRDNRRRLGKLGPGCRRDQLGRRKLNRSPLAAARAWRASRDTVRNTAHCKSRRTLDYDAD